MNEFSENFKVLEHVTAHHEAWYKTKTRRNVSVNRRMEGGELENRECR